MPRSRQPPVHSRKQPTLRRRSWHARAAATQERAPPVAERATSEAGGRTRRSVSHVAHPAAARAARGVDNPASRSSATVNDKESATCLAFSAWGDLVIHGRDGPTDQWWPGVGVRRPDFHPAGEWKQFISEHVANRRELVDHAS